MKTENDPQPDPSVQPKARGATPYGARVLRAPYMIKISRLEHLIVSKQMKVFEGLFDVSEGRTRSNQNDVLTT